MSEPGLTPDDWTVDRMLAVPAATRELTIKHVGPVSVIVLELEAPPRFISNFDPAELASQDAWLKHDPAASAVMDAYMGSVETDSERNHAWEDRLEPERIPERQSARASRAAALAALHSEEE